jgi:hypothetical protein
MLNQTENILQGITLFKEMKFEKMPEYDLELYKQQVKKTIGKI